MEAFSSVELTVWPSYALGGGTGTKAAAAGMAKPGARWSANRPPGYVDSGGNGAAMRAQPHAWYRHRDTASMLQNVMRDAVSTHGHPYAHIGAAMVALAVDDSLPGGSGRVLEAAADGWPWLFDALGVLSTVVQEDGELAAYWLPNWKHHQLGDWHHALEASVGHAKQCAAKAAAAIDGSTDARSGYRTVIDSLNLRAPERRGSGLETAIAALALVALSAKHQLEPTDALLCAVRELGTDTDTIATMAGSVIGCRAAVRPPGELLDAAYIAREAARVSAPGGSSPATAYPDLLTWRPPQTQADALLELKGGLAVAGLGAAEPVSDPIRVARSEFMWQWVRLASSQTLIIKRRSTLPKAEAAHVPAEIKVAVAATESPGSSERPKRSAAAHSGGQSERDAPDVTRTPRLRSDPTPLDGSLGRVREANYDVRVIGMQLARLAREEGAAVAAAFGAIVATELESLSRRGPSNRRS